MSYWYPLAHPTIGDEEIEAATAVLRSSNTTMGEKVEEFEEAFARRVGARHAIMVNSGSSADLLIAFAMPYRGGGEAIIPSVTWPTHLSSWEVANYTTVLADVGELNVTAETVADCLTDNTSVISVTHLMGVPCEMAGINKLARAHDLFVTEDCCEALGSTIEGTSVGTFSDAAAWSFFFSHHMTTMEGGMVTTGHQQFADKVRTLRSHGWARHLPDHDRFYMRLDGLDPRYTFIDQGFNLRPTEVQAAIGLVQLKRLDGFNEARAENFHKFSRLIADNPLVTLPRTPSTSSTSWFGIPLFVGQGRRDALSGYLESFGIETRPILAGNLVHQPAFHAWKTPANLPGADRIHADGLYIGLHPVERDMAAVAETINNFAEVAAA